VWACGRANNIFVDVVACIFFFVLYAAAREVRDACWFVTPWVFGMLGFELHGCGCGVPDGLVLVCNTMGVWHAWV